jgi:nucleoside-diphosphate-sugar epimerase
MRLLADSVIIFVSLAVGMLAGLLQALSLPGRAAFSELLATHVALYLWTVPCLGAVSIALMAVSGVYRKRPTRTSREKLLGVVQSIALSYGLLAFTCWWLGYGSEFALGQILAVGFSLTAMGSLGIRTAKTYFTHRFDVHPKRPVPQAPVERVLVIGGAGYIGSVLVRRLLRAGYEVRVLDQLLFGDAAISELFTHPRFDLMRGDFRHVDAVIQAVKGMDAVVHLGAIVGDPACALDEETTLQTNYAATALVADVCRGYGVSRFVFASTCSVYGANDSIVDEQSELNPVSLYAATKIDSEKILLASRSETFHPTILRLGTAFGWSQRPRFDLVVNLLTARAVLEKKVVIFNEEQWRPFVHVNDISRAFCLMLDVGVSEVSGEIFNVGSREMNHHLGDVGRVIHRLVPDTKVVHETNDDKRNYRVSFDKIRERLGFRSETTLQAGIQEIQEQLSIARIRDYDEARYHNHKSVEQTLSDTGEPALSLKLISERFSSREKQVSRELASV